MAARDKIVERLRVLGYSQDDLSRASGVAQSTISSILCNQCTPTERTLKRLAPALGVTPAWIISEIDADASLSEKKNFASNLVDQLTKKETEMAIAYMEFLIYMRAKEKGGRD